MQAACADLSLPAFAHDALKAPALFLPFVAPSLGKGALQAGHELLVEPKQRVARDGGSDIARDPAGAHDFDHGAAVSGNEAVDVFHGLILVRDIDFGGGAIAHPASPSGDRCNAAGF